MGKQSQPQLPQVAQAGRPPCRLAGRLHRRQEQADERADDRNHDQQFDQAETAVLVRTSKAAPGFANAGTHGDTFLGNQNFFLESSKLYAARGTSQAAPRTCK
jgi:hypothetical protein